MNIVRRVLWILPALLLSGCVVAPYAPYPYAYQGPVVYGPPAPYYVVPSAGFYYGYGGGWRHR